MCKFSIMSEQDSPSLSDSDMDTQSDSESAGDQHAAMDSQSDSDCAADQLSDPEPTPKKVKKHKPGIIYLSTVPYGMTSNAIKNYFSQFGEVRNVFFQLADRENYVGGLVGGSYNQKKKKPARRGRLIKGRVRFSEGWIEFVSRKKAKWVAEMCNNSPVGGKKSSPYYDCLWSIKYLGKRFLWGELSKRIAFEKEIHQRKMTNEIKKVTEETDQYIKASEIAERLERRNNNRPGQVGSDAGNGTATLQHAAVGIKQRLTEAEILEKQREKKMKDQKYKAKLQKSKLKKQALKAEKKVERKEQAKSLNLFVAKS